MKYHFVAFITVAIWGSTFVFTKMLLQAGLSPAQIFTLRFIIAYVLLLGYSFLRNKVISFPPKFLDEPSGKAERGGVRGGLNKRKKEADQTPSGSPYLGGENKSSFRLFSASWRDELLMIALGITGGSLYFLTENAAMLFTTATNTSLIVCSCPLFAMLLFALFFRQSEKITRVQALGSLIAFLGMTVVVLNGHFVLHLSPLGDLLAFGACLCWAVYSLLMKAAVSGYSSLFITRKVFIYGLLTIIPYYILVPSEASIFISPTSFLFPLSSISSSWESLPRCSVTSPGTGSSANSVLSSLRTGSTSIPSPPFSSPGGCSTRRSPFGSFSALLSSLWACILLTGKKVKKCPLRIRKTQKKLNFVYFVPLVDKKVVSLHTDTLQIRIYEQKHTSLLDSGGDSRRPLILVRMWRRLQRTGKAAQRSGRHGVQGLFGQGLSAHHRTCGQLQTTGKHV